MVYSVGVSVVDPSEQGFIPKPFGGGGSQVVLNTTSFADIIGQLNSIDQAMSAQEEGRNPQPISLVSTGCYINSTGEYDADGNGVRAGDGYRDCASACEDPAVMFNSSYTFWNCLTLGAASLYYDNMSMRVNQDELVAVGEKMGFDSLYQFNYTQIFDNTIQCIKGSCQDYSLGSCSDNITKLEISGSANQAMAIFDSLQDYCSGMDSVVNSDIAGPGVSACLQTKQPPSPSRLFGLKYFANTSSSHRRLSFRIFSRLRSRSLPISLSTYSQAGCNHYSHFSIPFKTACPRHGPRERQTTGSSGSSRKRRRGSVPVSTKRPCRARFLRRP